MKAAVLNALGGADQFSLDEVPDLAPKPTDIEVTVAAAAVNPVDIKTRSGFLKLDLTFPAVLGWDVAGVVTAIGVDVKQFSVGDRVIGMIAQPVHRYGTYAEKVVADQTLFALAPTSVALSHAAAIPLAGLTAVQTLDKLTLAEKSRVLVTGGAGAVGRIAIQLLIERGHYVGAIARDSDRDDLRELGAESITAIPESPTWDAVVDTAGIASAIDAVGDNGQFVAIDDNEQPIPQRGIIPRKSYVEQSGELLSHLVTAVDEGRLNIPVAQSYPLTDVGRAHSHFTAGGVRGKLLVIP